MITGLLGKKLGQTRVFTPEGNQIPVTKILAGPCLVVQIKTMEKDSLRAVKIGFQEAGKEKPRFLREIKIDSEEMENGKWKKKDVVRVEQVFQAGDKIQVTGISKGKGFAGVVKRWHFAGGPRTHGQSDRERAPGSIGQTTTPGRVYKGKRMAGRMGGEQVTIQGLSVFEVKPEENLLIIKGLIPGNRGSFVEVNKA